MADRMTSSAGAEEAPGGGLDKLIVSLPFKVLAHFIVSRICFFSFASVPDAVCRALGIPARPVSNLVSAHDANGTLTIDRYYDAKNNELNYDPFNPDGGSDSIWNFHVWVEAWMARPDLPKGTNSSNARLRFIRLWLIDDVRLRLRRLAGRGRDAAGALRW